MKVSQIPLSEEVGKRSQEEVERDVFEKSKLINQQKNKLPIDEINL